MNPAAHRGLAALLVAACGCTAGAPAASPLLDAPAAGLQLTLDTETPAGSELRVCKLVVIENAMTIGRVVSRFGLGTHHVELALTDLDGQAVDPTPFDCGSRTIARRGSFYAANDQAGDLTFGGGAALELPAGSVVLVELHALNATLASRTASAAVNLYATDAAGPKLGSFEITVPRSPATCRIAGSRYIQILAGDGLDPEVTMTLTGGDLSGPVPLFEEGPSDPLVFRPALPIVESETITVSCSKGACTFRGTYFPADAAGVATCTAD
jgi:hypothetical protein